MKINRNNNDVIHDIGYNSPKGIKTKNNLIYKIHEKSSNINNEVLLNKNIFRNDTNVNKSLNNYIQHNINMNKLNYYKKITKNKIIENRSVNIKNNNKNEIIISKINPNSLSNLMKYNNNKKKNILRRYNSPNEIRNLNSFTGNNKKKFK
jgi:hypothetical protein